MTTTAPLVGAPPPWRFGPLRKGLYLQLWLGADALAKGLVSLASILELAKRLGCPGVLFHGGPRTMAAHFDRYARLAQSYGLQALAAFGLDGHEDDAAHHHDELTPIEKAECMAQVASHPLCAAVVMDGESLYELHPDDAPAMCQRFHALAPGAFVVHQPWGWPAAHWRFPYEAFALVADCVAPQDYWGAFKAGYGRARYDYGHARYLREWAALEARRLEAIHQVDPRFETIEGYGHDDLEWALVRYLLEHADQPTFMWCEPAPTPATVACMQAAAALVGRGYAGPGAVLRFQRDHNATAPLKIDEDDKYGHQVAIALGLAA